MTEETYNRATNLRNIIEKEKKILKYWKDAVDATEETITLSNGLGYNGYEKTSIFSFMSFSELKEMAINRLTKSIERTFNRKGSEGWELVEWQPCPEPLDATSLTQSTKKSLNILATWKRELHE